MVSLYTILKRDLVDELRHQVNSDNSFNLNHQLASGHCYSLLQAAIAYDSWECFQYLMEKNVDVNFGPYGPYPMELAVQKKMQKEDCKYYDALMQTQT